MKSLSAYFLAVLIAIYFTGCVNAVDPEIQAFIRFQKESGSDVTNAYSRLPDAEKVKIFFGANKMHPPSGAIDAAVSKQSVAFLYILRNEIEHRNGFSEAYALNNAVIEKRKRGEITTDEIKSLKLRQLCLATNADLTVCATQLKLMQ